MAFKVYLVTSESRLSKKHTVSKVVGFVSTFGWESAHSAVDKATKKYPGHQVTGVHEWKKGKR